MKRTQNFPAGPMADIAFLLLIFFLVTTQFPKQEGIKTNLPPMNPVVSPVALVQLEVWLNSEDKIMVNGRFTSKQECSDVIYETMKDNPAKYRVSFQSHSGASYAAYVNVYDAVKQAYRRLHETEALAMHGKDWKTLSANDQNEIREKIPVRILESDLIY